MEGRSPSSHPPPHKSIGYLRFDPRKRDSGVTLEIYFVGLLTEKLLNKHALHSCHIIVDCDIVRHHTLYGMSGVVDELANYVV